MKKDETRNSVPYQPKTEINLLEKNDNEVDSLRKNCNGFIKVIE